MALWSFLDQFLAQKTVTLYNDGDMKRDFTFIDDIVDGIISALKYVHKMEAPQHELFNLGKGNVRTLHEFVDIIRRSLSDPASDPEGYRATGELLENKDAPGGEALFTSADLEKSKERLGFDPKVELEDGIPRFIQWYTEWLHTKQHREAIKYLLITTFYVQHGDPQRGAANLLNPASFRKDAQYRGYIEKWFQSFEAAAVDIASTDIVIIHDGLPPKVIASFPGIIFLDYSGYRVDRDSVNDVRYFHYQRYLEEVEALDRYQIILTTDLHDVHFGRDPFEYLESQLSGDATALNVGHEVHQKGWTIWPFSLWPSNWRKFTTGQMDRCLVNDKGLDLAKESLEWMDANIDMMPNPGIIAGGADTVRLLINEMVSLFQDAPKTEDCNMGMFTASLYQLCEKEQKCNMLKDDQFHSEFKGKDTSGHVVYHK